MLEYQLNYLGGRAERARRTGLRLGNAGLPGADSGQSVACAASGVGRRRAACPVGRAQALPACPVPGTYPAILLRPGIPRARMRVVTPLHR